MIWVDAHPDINSTETSDSGNFHGMPVYYTFSTSNTQGEPRLLDLYSLKHSVSYFIIPNILSDGITVDQTFRWLLLRVISVHVWKLRD